MDISGINSLYSDYLSDTTSTAASSAKLDESLSTDYSSSSDEQLMDVCKQFESYFLEQVFKEMEKTIPEDESTSGSTSSMVDYFKDTTIQELASKSTNQNSLGLAQTLFDQMKRNYNI